MSLKANSFAQNVELKNLAPQKNLLLEGVVKYVTRRLENHNKTLITH